LLQQQMIVMATLSDLVTALSGVTGLPEATVFAYGRFARQAGLISQKGRGRSAASMSVTDATNLLIAVCATDVTREAGAAIKTFRSLGRGRLYDFSPGLSHAILPWLEPLGIKALGTGQDAFEVRGNFGGFFEHLITGAVTGSLSSVFRHIPVAEIPKELWSRWKRSKSIHLEESMELLVEKGLVKPKEPSELEFGEDISLEVNFSRLVPAAEIEFRRMWDSPQTVFVITFGPERGAQSRAPHDMRLIATVTQHTLAAVGLVQADMVRAAAIRSYKPMDALFAQQFRRTTPSSTSETADAKRG
jgi:hypothetical protein